MNTSFDYFNRINNNTFHNLCTRLHLPPGLGPTLVLGLKFCVQTRKPDQKLDFQRFQNDVRKKAYFAGQIKNNDAGPCPKKRIVKKGWIAKPQSDSLEDKINKFIQTLTHLQNIHITNSKPSTNLTSQQQAQIQFLCKNKNCVILNCDKNLGPAIIEYQEYITLALNEHLHDKTT